ncbi:MAG TPA: ATP-binding protein [Nitrososphaerales archaeon]|nr:ATP-binding protein [Nitrososphaerales archaeon]
MQNEKTMEIAGQVVGGNVASILVRQKSDQNIELGDLLVADSDDDSYLILKVNNLQYGSQIPGSVRELAAGLKLEGYSSGVDFMDPKLRNYVCASVKPIAKVFRNLDQVKIPKVMPAFFSSMRFATEKDLAFLSVPPKNPVYLGQVRSGSKILEVKVYLNGDDAFTHHILIPATTGRGKSNLLKVILWSLMDVGKVGILVLDPHDEYYGRDGIGLKDHPKANKNLVYYSSDAVTGKNTLVVNLETLEPGHFDGIISFSDAQEDAIAGYYKTYKNHWLEQLILGAAVEGTTPRTLQVLQRKFRKTLGVSANNGQILCDMEIFSTDAGRATIGEITKSLEAGKIVVIDTSRLSDDAELIIGSIISNEIFYGHRKAKAEGKLNQIAPVSIVIEEAPRVLSAEAMEQSSNIYSTIAREGRKFKVGLVAITQLTSVIPQMVLTNMNTKIILGNEMVAERHAVMESSAQDLSDEDRTIASLDKGEAIVSSIFTKFAVPIYTPLFETVVAEAKKNSRNDPFDLSKEKFSL